MSDESRIMTVLREWSPSVPDKEDNLLVPLFEQLIGAGHALLQATLVPQETDSYDNLSDLYQHIVNKYPAEKGNRGRPLYLQFL
jgi:hypothetical protein